MGAMIDRIAALDLDDGMRDGLRDTASRLRSEADELLKDMQPPSERDRTLLFAASALIIAVAIASIFLARRRRGTMRKSARRASRKSPARRRSNKAPATEG